MPDKKEKSDIKHITSLKEVRVFNDPYRREILTAMSLLDKPATSKMIADYLGEPPSKINYHVGILYKHGFLELDHTENINGIIAKFFTRCIREVKFSIEGDDSKAKQISALREMVSSVFDTTRDKHLASLVRNFSCEKDCEDEIEEMLISKPVFLTPEELKEFENYIEKIIHFKSKKGRKAYDLFTAYIEMEDHNNK